jgi:hypothetical protein
MMLALCNKKNNRRAMPIVESDHYKGLTPESAGIGVLPLCALRLDTHQTGRPAGGSLMPLLLFNRYSIGQVNIL